MTERDEAIELAKEYSHPNKHPDLNRLAIALLSEVERNEKLEVDHRELVEVLRKIYMAISLGVKAEDTPDCLDYTWNIARTTLEGLRIKE